MKDGRTQKARTEGRKKGTEEMEQGRIQQRKGGRTLGRTDCMKAAKK